MAVPVPVTVGDELVALGEVEAEATSTAVDVATEVDEVALVEGEVLEEPPNVKS